MGVRALFSLIVKKHSAILRPIENRRKSLKSTKVASTTTKSSTKPSKAAKLGKSASNDVVQMPQVEFLDAATQPGSDSNPIIQNAYFDSNSIVYDVAKENPKTSEYTMTRYESMIIKKTCEKLVDYIKFLAPTDNVIIAFDGPAPLAKLEQQRQRRYKSAFVKQLVAHTQKGNGNGNGNSNGKSQGKNTASEPAEQVEAWDTTAITPGTAFMKKLSVAVTTKFADPAKFNLQNLIVTTSEEVGEGEHKIFQYIRDHPDQHVSQHTVIYGLDADLIMLSLNHLRFCDQISLYRETPHFIQNIDNSISPDQAYLMDINALAFQLLEELGSNITDKSSYRSQAHAYNIAHTVTKLIGDYILISFILGNDFLPHAPAFNIRTKGMQILLNTYREHIGKKGLFLTDPLSTSCSIDWKNFRLFLEKLGEQELSNLQREHRQRDKLESLPPRVREGDDPFLAKLDSLPVHIRAKERYIAPEHDDWQRRYYKVTLDATLADRKTICTDYLKTLEWNFKYYTSGCPDWRWTYRFRCAPLIQDLAKHVPIFASELMPFTEPRPVSAITQLAYVLPISTHHYLPDKVQSNLHKYMSEYYGENYEIDWTYCKYFWESHAVLPEMHLDKLETLTRRF